MNELLIDAVGPMRDWFLGLGDWGVALWIVLKILAIAVPVIVAVAFYVVWERKLIGWMHVRHGPMYVGMGVFQAFADVFKLLFKEVILPASAHKTMYLLAPLIVLAPAFALFFLAEYANMILVSFLITIFFLGGWLSPIQGWVVADVSPWVDWIWKGGWPWTLLKVLFFASAYIWFRATFPRYRYDQIMRLGWKVFIPITIAWIAVTALMAFYGVFEKGA